MKALIFLFFLIHVIYGNSQIIGAISDEDGAPLPFASVVLRHAMDSSFYKGTISDIEGAFEVSNVSQGSYFAVISSIGYEDHYTPPFEIESTNSRFILGSLSLEEESVLLNDVVVSAQKLKVEQKPEGMVLNVASSLISKGSSALQLIERSPGVVLDQRNNTLTLNGQDGTLIMINGRPMRMSSSEITNLLRGMSADNVEKIELLTNPSSKYDADGGAGIINLILKKNESQGTNGSASLSLGYGSGQKETISLNLNHRSTNTNYFGTYAFTHDDSHYGWQGNGSNHIPVFNGETYYDFQNETDQKTTGHNVQLGVEKEFTKNLLVGANILYNHNENKTSVLNSGDYFFSTDPFVNTRIQVDGSNTWETINTVAFAEKTVSENSKLNLEGEYLHFENAFPTLIENSYFNENNEIIFPENEVFVPSNRGISITTIDIGVLKSDYHTDISNRVNLEAGVKGTYSITKNAARIEQLIDGNWSIDQRTDSHAEITELISAAYSSIHIKLDSVTSFTAGLRYEQWVRDFGDANLDQSNGSFFPTFFASRALNSHLTLQFAYNKRISRPSFNDLAANLSYNSPTAVFGGNSSLRATLTDNLRLGLQINDLSVAIIYTHEINPIVRFQVDRREDSDLIVISPQNMAYQDFIGIQTHSAIPVARWLSLTVGGSFGQRRFRLTHTPEAVMHNYFALNTYGSADLELPFGLRAEVSGFYNGDHYYGSMDAAGFGQVNLGLKKDLKNDSGSLQFSITDVFQSMRYQNEIGVLTPEHYEGQFSVKFTPESGDNRIYRITYSKSFGSNKVKGRKRRDSSNEGARVNRG